MARPGRKLPSLDALARYGLLLGVLGSLLLALGVFDGPPSRAQERAPRMHPLLATSPSIPTADQRARLRRWNRLQRASAAHDAARRRALGAELERAREARRRRIAARRPSRRTVRRAPVVRPAPLPTATPTPTPTFTPAPYVPPVSTPAPPPPPRPDPEPKPADPGTGFDLTG